MKKRTLEFGCVNGVIWYVGDDGKLDKDEWQSFLLFVRTILLASGEQPVLAWGVGYGTGPDALQRRKLIDEFAAYDVRVAVNTDSIIARGVVKVFAWFKPNFRAFEIHDRNAAAEYLQLSTAVAYRVLKEMNDAEARMGKGLR